MVICFDASSEATDALRKILSTGRYPDINVAISAALTNLAVLDAAVTSHGGLILGTPHSAPTTSTDATSSPPPAVATPSAELKRPTPPFDTSRVVGAVPKPASAVKHDASPKDWLWGQFNKILPVKVACRATLNLLLQNPAIKPAEAATIVTKKAAGLAALLRKADEASGRKRDEAFASAFPSTEADNEKSMLRFAEQFVYGTGSFATSSLPIQLGFIACDGVTVRLTPAGLEFAELENPILDGNLAQSADKFSAEELSFLRAHILAEVPQERSALRAILTAVENGATNPDAVDAYLRQTFAKIAGELTEPFLATQRTGAISRAVELKLLRRARQGIRVTYIVEPSGREFLNA